jgi:hypothetical protein
VWFRLLFADAFEVELSDKALQANDAIQLQFQGPLRVTVSEQLQNHRYTRLQRIIVGDRSRLTRSFFEAELAESCTLQNS